MRAPNKPEKLVARENLIALLNRMKRYYDKAAANCGALAEKMQTASDDDVGRVDRELMSAFRLGSLAPKDWQAEVAKRLQELHKAQTASARSKRHPGSDEKNAMLAEMHELGESLSEMAKKLKISKDAVRQRLKRLSKH
jgi:hypothetical protein